MGSKAKFVLDTEKKVTCYTSIEYLEKLNTDEILAYDANLIKDTLIHLGNISDSLSIGSHIFINQNYSAQRIKKLAFGQQSRKNVIISQGSIEFVKSQYKGNWEQLRHHKDLINMAEANRSDNTFNLSDPVDQILFSFLKNKVCYP